MCKKLVYERRDNYNHPDYIDLDMSKICDDIEENLNRELSGFSENLDEIVFIFKNDLTLEEVGYVNELMDRFNFSLV